MKNKRIIILSITIIFTFLFLLINLYNYIRIKTANIEITLKDNLNIEFNDKVTVSDLIESINGNIINDVELDTTKLGKKRITFKFKNNDGINLKYSFDVNVVDNTKPLIWLNDTYTVLKDSKVDLTKQILCGDNYDSKPKCVIEGSYDLSVAGDYSLVYKATDSSGNTETAPFTLHVIEPEPENDETAIEEVETLEENYTLFSDVVSKYKNKDTKIGIDVSSWQGKIDFKKLKKAGVEFVMIRVGGTRGLNKEYFVDENFKYNIKEANKNKIDVGIYFYSYANTVELAKKDAKWVLKQIKDYDVNLPIAFDWENWKYYNEYNLSFFGLTSMAEAFLDEIEKNGYKGMLYSSKTYLENIWMNPNHDIWLAHYTDQTSYTGDYKMWQMCENGKVDGIDTLVDIDILYK